VTKEEFKRIIDRARGSLSVLDWCIEQHISYNTMSSWRQGRNRVGERWKTAGQLILALGPRARFVLDEMEITPEQMQEFLDSLRLEENPESILADAEKRMANLSKGKARPQADKFYREIQDYCTKRLSEGKPSSGR
jgi:ATP-dependent helicase YprA (DUF1998 family)